MTAAGGVDWVDNLVARARAALPGPVFDHVVLGADAGLSAAEAVEAWRQVRFLPHVLRDVGEVDLSGTVLGHRVEVPWGVAPTSPQRAVHPDGELAMARATTAAGSLLVVSSNSGTGFAELAATGVHWWLQIYLTQNRSVCEPVLTRAVAAGAAAVVLTVDTPVVGAKRAAPVWESLEPDIVRINFDDGHEQRPGSMKARDLGPQDIAWLAEVTGLPVVVKGVLRADDARQCLGAGAAAVWVSNHGGRQLDRAAATASCLGPVLDAVAGECAVYVDGGLRGGLDILAALALGADHVFLGRLPLLALVEGEPGVSTMHAALRQELGEAMRLAGCRDLADTRDIAVPLRK